MVEKILHFVAPSAGNSSVLSYAAPNLRMEKISGCQTDALEASTPIDYKTGQGTRLTSTSSCVE